MPVWEVGSTMEIKGWNDDYLNFKIEQYQNLYENATDDDMRAQYEEQLNIYQNLLLVLLFQGGITYREKVSTADFLDMIYQAKSDYYYDQDLSSIFSNITKQFIDMQGFRQYELKKKFKKEEGLELVGEFIKSSFGLKSFHIYADTFLKNQDYILFDKNDENASILYTLEGERFIKIPSNGTVSMVAAIAHEAGHNYGKSVNHCFKRDDILREFESYGYEIYFLNWLIKNHIYEQEAIKCMLNSMRLLENGMIAKYYNDRYHLTSLKSSCQFESMLTDGGFFLRIQPQDMYEVFDTIGMAIEQNVPMYLYSFLCVLDCLSTNDFPTKYQIETSEFGKTDSKVLAKKLLTRDITDLGNYRNWREDMMCKVSHEN